MKKKSRFRLNGSALVLRPAPPIVIKAMGVLKNFPDNELVDVMGLASKIGFGMTSVSRYTQCDELAPYRVVAPSRSGKRWLFGNAATIKKVIKELGAT